MRIKIKNLKNLPALSLDSHAFTASIYLDNKKVGTAIDRGDGMPPQITWTNCDDETFLAVCISEGFDTYYEYSLRDILEPNENLDFNVEAALEVALDLAETEKQVKKSARTKIVFWKDELTSWLTVKAKPTQENFERLRHHHGLNIFIFNEHGRIPMPEDLTLN
jgi:hypothetical protein